MPKVSITSFAIYHLYYKEKQKMTEFAYKPFLFQLLPNLIDSAHNHSFLWSLFKLLSLPDVLSDSVVKFLPQHLYYKDKLNGNQTWTFICIVGYLYLGYSLNSLGNSLAAFLFAQNSSICIVESNIVIKKGELPRTILDLSHPFQSPFLFFNLKIFKYMLISG